MLAEIITIGDEILIGQIVDTNSAWMAQKLNQAGIRVKQITSVSDAREHILDALKLAASRADVILITGGLGPTKDDITKKTLAEYFAVNLYQDEESLENVKQIFSKYNSPLLEVNIRQADVLENCIVLQNKNGTAPGMWIEDQGKIYVSLPGVPFEMMYLMEENVIPKLQSSFKLPAIVHHTILTSGIGESFLAKEIEDIEDSLPDHIKLAYLPRLGQVRLRLSAYGSSEEVLKEELKVYSQKIINRISSHVVAELDISLEKIILDYMHSRNLTLSTAESCTGGYISHLITQLPGCSAVFVGGAVSYSYKLKQIMLGVNEKTLEEFGAVSEETVKEMALGAIKNYDSDYSVAVSGIAGPDGGLPDKPVGTVWIAVANRNRVKAKKFQFANKRAQNIERSAINALTMLFKFLKEDHP
ncbi:competence/damage-inducible protein A [Daejeonella oryzae]|uniref:competence/damage-inducible protein A n=1 Tax=Daejeonella oryzae TaxID=1122943 RepID=UPI0004181FB5|nr:competence/damage-inducible protein A [Daejeonella oryzae]